MAFKKETAKPKPAVKKAEDAQPERAEAIPDGAAKVKALHQIMLPCTEIHDRDVVWPGVVFVTTEAIAKALVDKGAAEYTNEPVSDDAAIRKIHKAEHPKNRQERNTK